VIHSLVWVILRPIWPHLVKRRDRCRYGKRYIMTKNFSPDAFMQVAFQCAYRFESRMFSTAFPFILSQPRIWRNCQHVRNCDDQKVPSRAYGGRPLHHCCSRQILQSEMGESGMMKPRFTICILLLSQQVFNSDAGASAKAEVFAGRVAHTAHFSV
jgi:hypothetical protein